VEILVTRTSRLRTTRQAAHAASGTARTLAGAQESLAHAFPSSARHRLGLLQLDPSAWVVTGLERCRLAWDVVRIGPRARADQTCRWAGRRGGALERRACAPRSAEETPTNLRQVRSSATAASTWRPVPHHLRLETST
jgi:hypothetical protein